MWTKNVNILQRHRFLLQKPWWSVSIILFSARSFIILFLISILTNFVGAKVIILSSGFPRITFTVKYHLQHSCFLRQQLFETTLKMSLRDRSPLEAMPKYSLKSRPSCWCSFFRQILTTGIYPWSYFVSDLPSCWLPQPADSNSSPVCAHGQ